MRRDELNGPASDHVEGSDFEVLRRLGAGAEEASRRAASAFTRAAAQRGLIDVAYGYADSPFGPLLVALTRRGLVTLAYPGEDDDVVLERLSWEVSPRVLESAPATDPVRRELDEYFDGRRRRFGVPVDFRLTHGFSERVLRQTARIPYGSVATYRDVATRAGSPRGMRAAGNALASNPIPIVVPCHRVVNTGGGLGGYTGGLDRKVTLLRLEGAMAEAPVSRTAKGGPRPRG
jgi:methylated-DNA-[protein]-cysteine S-methyltransferase